MNKSHSKLNIFNNNYSGSGKNIGLASGLLLAILSTAILTGCTVKIGANDTPDTEPTVNTSQSTQTERHSTTREVKDTSTTQESEKSEDSKRVEDKIQDYFTKEIGASLNSINCPGNIEFSAGNSYDCQA